MNRRGFLGHMIGALCGAAVGPLAIKATELPRAAALTVAPAAAIAPEVLERVVLTNEVIANEALRLLRENLAFVRARYSGIYMWGPVHPRVVVVPDIRRPSRGPEFEYHYADVQQSAVNLLWTPELMHCLLYTSDAADE